MNPSRTDYARQIDWSAVKGNAVQQCQNQILRRLFVCHNPQNFRELCVWLRGRPPEFVQAQLDALLAMGAIEAWRLRYAIPDKETRTSAPEVGVSDIRAESK